MFIGLGITLSSRGSAGAGFPSIQLSGLTIAEDAAGLDEIGTASVANGSGTYTWAITADPDSKFAIDESTGVLSLAELATLDYETATSHLVTIQADNGADDPISRQFTISVTNVLEVTLNELSLDADEITENSAEDTSVGAVVGKSSGSTLSLIDDAGGRFKLSGTNIVAGATNTDYEAATSYNITLRETHPDASNSPNDTVIPITVVDDPDDTDTVPDAFEVGDWSIAAGDEQADVTISSLPADGGDTITDVEYRLDGGSWVSSGGTTSFTITSLTNDVEYDVELRAVNSVGAGAASDVKQVTPEDATPAWSPLDLGADLMMWLPLDDPAELWQASDGTTAVSADNDPIGQADDQSANNRHADQSTSGARPRFRTGTPNYAEFGPDDYLESASNFNSTQFGFAARIYRSGSQTNGGSIFDFWGPSVTNGRIMFFNTNRLSLQWLNTSGGNLFNLDNSFFIQWPGTFPDAEWHHIAVNISGTAGTLYLDGVSVRTQNFVSGTPRNPNGTALSIGKQPGASNYFNGRMRQLVIINRPFTQDEIDELVAMP